MIDIRRHVADLVQERPSRARVFEALGINYCCGGAVPFQDAVAERGLDPEAIAATMAAAEAAQEGESEADVSAMSSAELVDHIVETYHNSLRRELPRLREMVHKVAEGHGHEDPRLVALRTAYLEFEDDIRSHLASEEERLFPRIRAGETDTAEVAELIEELEGEHEKAAKALATMRTVTDGFQAFEGACNSTRATLHAFEELEREMHRHVHTENNVLFPRFEKAAV
jgi:regulator of cell morphogenesis and NO signaling